MNSRIQILNSNGDIFLGKEYAGKTVVVDQTGEYSWVIKTVDFIPDFEKLPVNPGKY